MPTINIQISNVKQKQSIITFIATDENDRVIERVLDRSDINDWTDFANWLINQEPDFELLPDKEKSLSITFHTETVTDPETGSEATIRVVDGVVVT